MSACQTSPVGSIRPSRVVARRVHRATNRSVPGLIRPPSVPLLGAFSVGIARKRPRLLRISAPSSNARTICGAFVYTRLAASSLWFG